MLASYHETPGKALKVRSDPLPKRDKFILKSIHEFDGMLGAFQIMRLPYEEGKPLFTSWYRTRIRLAKLYKEGYVNHPDRKMRAALPQQIYWLTKNGAKVVAGMYGKQLVGDGFKWRGKVRWSLVPHDLDVNDFRIAVMLACEQLGEMTLAEWTPSGEFWARPDPVEYKGFDGKMLKRGVRPDGYFVLHDHQTEENIRFLLELDRNANEDLRRIADEKILPGLEYLTSEAYQRRAGRLPDEGFKSGRWLFVISTTDAALRLSNMKLRIEQVAGKNAGRFWLTTLSEAIGCENVLTSPIWSRGGQEYKVSLLG